ncbi:hypothetical protein MMC20_007601 [Loxospora ochrophaea]|nr:hypothetical protein [Loxospora ochrophaea]
MVHRFYGWIVEDNGRAVKEEEFKFCLFFGEFFLLEKFRDPPVPILIVLLEWDRPDQFYRFVASEDFKAFAGRELKARITAPPTIQLYQGTLSPFDAATCTFTELVRTTVKAGASSEIGKAWDSIIAEMKFLIGTPVPVTHGLGIGHEEETYIGVIGWDSIKTRNLVRNRLDRLETFGKTSRTLLDLSPMESTFVSPPRSV